MIRIPAKVALEKENWLTFSVDTWKLQIPMHEYSLGFYVFKFTAQTNDMYREIRWVLHAEILKGGGLTTWSR